MLAGRKPNILFSIAEFIYKLIIKESGKMELTELALALFLMIHKQADHVSRFTLLETYCTALDNEYYVWNVWKHKTIYSIKSPEIICHM